MYSSTIESFLPVNASLKRRVYEEGVAFRVGAQVVSASFQSLITSQLVVGNLVIAQKSLKVTNIGPYEKIK